MITTDRRARWGRRGLVAGLSLSLGCSFMFVEGPKPNYAHPREISCTHSPGWPIVDVLLAAAGVARTLDVASHSEDDYKGATFSRGTNIQLGIAFATVAAFSAGYGLVNVNSCNEVTAAPLNPRHRPSPTTSGVPRPTASPPPIVAEPDDGAGPDGGAPEAGAKPATVPQQIDPE